MIVVSNTSPIFNLAAIGHIDLLQSLYGSLLIPEAVAYELTRITCEKAISFDVTSLAWIGIRPVTNVALVSTLQLDLDAGEAEAITLAVDLPADLLLIDERRGRHIAQRRGIVITGVLGVLLAAKQERLLLTVKPLLDDLIAHAGFWLGPTLYTEILKAAGE